MTGSNSESGQTSGQGFGIVGASLSAFAWGASGVFAKAISLGGLTVVAYRFWMSTIVFFAFMALTNRLPNRQAYRAALPGAVALAVDVVLFFSAVKLTTVANATVVASLQPLLMMALGIRLLGETVRRSQVGLALVALAGVAILVYGSTGSPEWSLSGDLLAVGALLAWTAYMFFSKSSQSRVSPLEYTAITGLASALLATVLAFVFGQDMSWPDNRDWLLLGAMAFGSGMFAHLMMNWALTRIPVWLGSTMTLVIPAAATTMAWLWLGESVSMVQLGGIGLSLAALAGLMLSRLPGRERTLTISQ